MALGMERIPNVAPASKRGPAMIAQLRYLVGLSRREWEAVNVRGQTLLRHAIFSRYLDARAAGQTREADKLLRRAKIDRADAVAWRDGRR